MNKRASVSFLVAMIFSFSVLSAPKSEFQSENGFFSDVSTHAKTAKDLREFVQNIGFSKEIEDELLQLGERESLLMMTPPKISFKGLEMKIETSGSPGLNIAMSENAELIWVGAKKYRVPLQGFAKFFDEVTKDKKEKSSKKRAQYWLKLLSIDEAEANPAADVLAFFTGAVVAGGHRIYKQFCSGDANGEGRSQMKICNSKDEDAVKSLISSGALNSFKCDDDRLTELKSGKVFGEHRFVFQYDGEDRLERVKDFAALGECEYFVEKGRVVKTHGNSCRSTAKGQGPQAITEIALARINSCCRNPECVGAISGKETAVPAIAPAVAPITPAVR